MSSGATLFDQAYVDMTANQPPFPTAFQRAWHMVEHYAGEHWFKKLGRERTLRVLCYIILEIPLPPDLEEWQRCVFFRLIASLMERILNLPQ